MIEVVMKVDDEFWDNITQLTVFKEQKEIVHCKDCKYSKPSVISDRWVCTNYSLPGDLKADDFCSRGEKKDEEGICR